jgi:TetR/AcrR family transcriptional regulator
MPVQKAATAEQPPPNRVGRPRLDSRASSASPREDILRAAARLFAEVGYANTTMSEIARAAGLQQSSLYYWFRRKEMILQATLEINRLPVEFLEKIQAEPASAALKLYRLLRFDIYQLCLSPFDVNEVERQAEQQPELFASYWEDNQRLNEGVCALLQAGMEAGELVECEPRLASLSLLSTHEGMQKRFRYQSRHASSDQSSFVYRAYAAEEIAGFVAQMALRGLLRRPAQLAGIQQKAAAHRDF